MCAPRPHTLLPTLAPADFCEVAVAADPAVFAASPPRAVRLLVNDHRLPRAVRAALHEANVARCRDYAAAFAAYLDRFVALVGDARSLHEVRALGLPVACTLPDSEPGVEIDGDPLANALRRRVGRPDDRRVLHAIHQKGFALRGA